MTVRLMVRQRGLQGVAMAAVLAALGLSGCTMAQNAQSAVEIATAPSSGPLVDKAVSAMSRGDFPNAERYAVGAVNADPKDPFALFIAGQVYQATGRLDLARQYYEVITTNNMRGMIMVPGESSPQPKSVYDAAQANIALIDRQTGRGLPRGIGEAGRGEAGRMSSQLDAAAGSMVPGGMPQPGGGDPALTRTGPTDAELNVAARFRILRRLLDDGLLTRDEFARRRMANLGALLPYSAAPPAQGLERPTPGETQVTARLAALTKALEGREMDSREYMAERSAILDALLPAEPRRAAYHPLPPKDLIEAGQIVGRLERLRSQGLITDAEMLGERAAVERGLDSHLATMPVDGSATGVRYGGAASTAKAAAEHGPFGVGLGFGSTEEEARMLWDAIKAKFPEQLGAMNASYVKSSGAKGTRWRVVAGPFTGKTAAAKMCKQLKLHRQSCDVTGFAK